MYQRAMWHAVNAMVFTDPVGIILETNPAFDAMFRFQQGEAQGTHISLCFPPDWRGGKWTRLRQATQERGGWAGEVVGLRRDGTTFPRWLSTSAIANSDGHLVAMMSISLDLTEIRRAETALQASEARYKQIVETVREGIWLIDDANRTIFVNPAMAAMLGYTVDEMQGKPVFAFMENEGRAICERNIQRRQHGIEEDHEFKLQHRNGSDVWVMMRANPMYGEDGAYAGALALVSNLSDRKHLEAQLRSAQKRDALGRLAGEVAHDFNNMLTVMHGFALLSLSEAQTPLAVQRNLNEILVAAKRASALTNQLLAFSRQQTPRPRVLDPNAILTEMVGMLTRLLGDHIELSTQLSPLGRSLRIDPTHLEQIVMNLCVNARDAMTDGGTLTIATRSVFFGPDEVSHRPNMEPGYYIELSVKDTGHGMDAETAAHIFEPFFTTKPTGKGTGLGLATVYGIVKENGGSITVTSELGVGTRFDMYFPSTSEPPERTMHESGASSRGAQGSETVLVVDDDPGMRALTCALLQAAGYRVLEASLPWQAVELASDPSVALHLLLTDVIMPQVNGIELAQRLHALRPGLKILYMSGYTDEMLGDLLATEDPLLQKPFFPQTLTDKVREVLDSR
ncbi:MAG: PAS domain S-box protein [Nitrospirales bacterium]